MFEVPQRPSKRHGFSIAEKWSLLLEYDKCLDRGAKAAFCRTVSIRPDTIRKWVIARDEGRLRAPEEPESTTTSRASRWMNSRERDELNRLRKENLSLRAKLEKSEAAVDILGKASALLDALARSACATDPHMEESVPGRPEWLQGPVQERPLSPSAE